MSKKILIAQGKDYKKTSHPWSGGRLLLGDQREPRKITPQTRGL